MRTVSCLPAHATAETHATPAPSHPAAGAPAHHWRWRGVAHVQCWARTMSAALHLLRTSMHFNVSVAVCHIRHDYQRHALKMGARLRHTGSGDGATFAAAR